MRESPRTAVSATHLSTLMGECQLSTKPKSETSNFTALLQLPYLLDLPLNHFHPFLSLPLEIREMIWKFALPGPRELYLPHNLRDVFRIQREFKLSLSQVCFESRRIVLEAGYQLVYTGDVNLPEVGVWLCKERGDRAWKFAKMGLSPFENVSRMDAYYLRVRHRGKRYYHTYHFNCHGERCEQRLFGLPNTHKGRINFEQWERGQISMPLDCYLFALLLSYSRDTSRYSRDTSRYSPDTSRYSRNTSLCLQQ
ncbi:hypothetical protein EV127DRAFT_176120 [Xylaria flabelliformis]|nr:hypothetical protein EV127DRAFT_176120 [Xylaria flabelliformis]